MRFYTKQHHYDCGIDLHARKMYMCVLDGEGKILALVILYESHDIGRFPRVQDFVSYCRLVKCAKESNGKLYGDSGKKIGNAHLKWAFSEAAVLFLRHNPPAQHYVTTLVSLTPLLEIKSARFSRIRTPPPTSRGNPAAPVTGPLYPLDKGRPDKC